MLLLGRMRFMNDRLFINLQRVIPHHALSRCSHYIAECKYRWFKNLIISWFIKRYQVDLSEAREENYKNYSNFNEFFTRQLKSEKRPLPEDKSQIVSPADGVISQFGQIDTQGKLIQAKGHYYDVQRLLGGDEATSNLFTNGHFATIYLSPRDYHRVHMPASGTLRKMIHVPGRLFSVNQATTENLPNLFARNERVISIFDTKTGPMAVVMVGAMIVASIETVWENLVTPKRNVVTTRNYPKEPTGPIHLKRGAEMGRFKLGSTAIILFPENSVHWLDKLHADQQIMMGQTIGQCRIPTVEKPASKQFQQNSAHLNSLET